MRRKIIISLLAVLISTFITAQDLIITHKGDSLNCKITQLKKDNIYFTFKHEKSNEIRNTLLPLTKVQKHQYNFYKTSEVPASYQQKTLRRGKGFQLAITGGYSYRLARVPDNIDALLKDYIKGLKSGFHFGADATYFFNDVYGAGLKFNQAKFSNRLSNVTITNYDTGESATGVMEDLISLTFIGPSYTNRYLVGERGSAFITNISFGYLGYVNEARTPFGAVDITSQTFGVAMDVDYDISIATNLALRLQLSYLAGSLITVKYNYGSHTETITLNKDNLEGVHRIDLSIGLRYQL